MTAKRPAGDGPSSPGAARTLRIIAILLAMAHFAPYREAVRDETYVQLQIARNVLRGEGPVVQTGERARGAPGPIWGSLVAAAGFLTPGSDSVPDDASRLPALAWTAKAVGGIAALLSVLLLPRLGRRLGFDETSQSLLAILLALNAWFARSALDGLEAPLVVLTTILALEALLAALLDGTRSFRAGAWLAASALLRTDLLALALLGFVAVAVAGARERPRILVRVAAGFAIIWLPGILWAGIGSAGLGLPAVPPYGEPAAWSARALHAAREAAQGFLATEAMPLAAAALALIVRGGAERSGVSLPRPIHWVLLVAWSATLPALAVLWGARLAAGHLLPALPAVLLIAVGALRRARLSSLLPRAVSLVGIAVAAYAAQNLAVTIRAGIPQAIREANHLRATLAEIGVWARSSTPEGSRFAAAEIGAFGFFSDRSVIDLTGRFSQAMAPVARRGGYFEIVRTLQFEVAGRPSYLIDRAPGPGRLAVPPDPENPYRFLTARPSDDRRGPPSRWDVYSVYAIDWDRYDRRTPRLARASVRDAASLSVL